MFMFVVLSFVIASPLGKADVIGQNPVDNVLQIVDNLGNVVYVDALAPITRTPTKNDITYYIYTQNKSPDSIPGPDFQNQLTSTQFNPNLKTYFVTHGWTGDTLDLIHKLLTNAILQFYNVNVIYVDWSPAAEDPTYVNARAAVNPIGGFVGDDINFMMDTLNYPSSYVYLAGFSLGGNVVGAAGARTGGRVYSIVGLDPAKPLFNYSDPSSRLDPTDGQYVHVIHTNSDYASFMEPLGHSDYYPNGGSMQAGCLGVVCSHVRAVEYFAESMNSAQIFTAHLCANYSDYSNNKCSSNPTSRLGQFDVDRTASGTYYLNTNWQSPYALG